MPAYTLDFAAASTVLGPPGRAAVSLSAKPGGSTKWFLLENPAGDIL